MLLPEFVCTPSFRSVVPEFFWLKCHIWLFLIIMVTIFQIFLAHVLSWVKTCHYTKFQRNLSTHLARMMVQTYIQTNTGRHIHTFPFIYTGDKEILLFSFYFFFLLTFLKLFHLMNLGAN